MNTKPECLFHRRDLRYEDDVAICNFCNTTIPIDGEYAPLPEFTFDQFAALTRTHTAMMEQASARTQKILDRIKHRGYLLRADEYGAVIEYNNHCHCHPKFDEFTIPAEWLFAEDWEAKVDKYMADLEAKQLAAEAEIDKLREAQERKDLARLQAKYSA